VIFSLVVKIAGDIKSECRFAADKSVVDIRTSALRPKGDSIGNYRTQRTYLVEGRPRKGQATICSNSFLQATDETTSSSNSIAYITHQVPRLHIHPPRNGPPPVVFRALNLRYWSIVFCL
jgi:hypothetical protein